MEIIKVATYYFVRVVNYLILIRIVMSWLVKNTNNSFYIFIYQVTEPILAPFRELLKKFGVGGVLDFSPILAILTMQILANIIYSL